MKQRAASKAEQPEETILEEAARLTSTDRQATYGHPRENHGKTAALWTAQLGMKLRNPITAREVCWLNVLQKASRDSYSPKRDNLTDGAGYLRNAEMIVDADQQDQDDYDRDGAKIEEGSDDGDE